MRENFPVCEISCIHTDDVDTVREKMPEDEVLYELADLFKVFSDSTRIKILWALSVSELCVCDIAHLLDMTQSAISHHLRTLKLSRLVKSRKSGKIVYFENNDLCLQGITNKTFTPRKNTCTSIDFTLDNRASVTLSETYPIEKEWKTVEKKIEVNTSHNFIRCPKRYDDFLYLLDYKNNIKSEYFDIEKLR